MGVRVNALLPGATDTKFASALIHGEDAAFRAGFMGRVALGRVAQPDEMSGAVLYLVSPGASYTTGACLVVDGEIGLAADGSHEPRSAPGTALFECAFDDKTSDQPKIEMDINIELQTQKMSPVKAEHPKVVKEQE